MRSSFSVSLSLAPLALLAASSLIACSSSDTSTPVTATDTGADFGDGPITTRPDDGVDTEVTDSGKGTDSSTDTNPADSAKGDVAADSAKDTAEETLPAGTHLVKVGEGGLVFSPSTLTIKVNETVRWQWAASGHSVTSGSACTADSKFCSPGDTSCATGTTSIAGAIYEHKFTTAGAFPYFCTPHCISGMVGTVTVSP